MAIGTNYNADQAKNSLKDPVWQTSTDPKIRRVFSLKLTGHDFSRGALIPYRP